MENGNPRSAAHVQEEEESIGGAAADFFCFTARVFLEEEGGAAVDALDSSRLQNCAFGYWKRRGAIPFRGNLDSSSRFWGKEETGPTLTRASGRFRP